MQHQTVVAMIEPGTLIINFIALLIGFFLGYLKSELSYYEMGILNHRFTTATARREGASSRLRFTLLIGALLHEYRF